MSQAYEGQDPIQIAKQAERDLNSEPAKGGHGLENSSRNTKQDAVASDSSMGSIASIKVDRTLTSITALESGVDEGVRSKFPGADVTIGSAASGAGNNRDIPLSEGGDINRATGKLSKAGDFEGVGGPEDKVNIAAAERPGDNDVRGNIRQGGETIRPAGSLSNDAVGGTGKSTQ